MLDFKNFKSVVKEEVAKLNEKDENWMWSAVVNKGSIKVDWGYFKYLDEKEARFVIKEDNESSTDDYKCIKVIDPFGETCSYAIIGDKFYCDGNEEDCIRKMFNSIFSASKNW